MIAIKVCLKGSLEYKPAENWNSEASRNVEHLSLVARDGNGSMTTATLAIIVLPVNDAPKLAGLGWSNVSFVHKIDEDQTATLHKLLLSDDDHDSSVPPDVYVMSLSASSGLLSYSQSAGVEVIAIEEDGENEFSMQLRGSLERCNAVLASCS